VIAPSDCATFHRGLAAALSPRTAKGREAGLKSLTATLIGGAAALTLS
jgi:hypothetical protein